MVCMQQSCNSVERSERDDMQGLCRRVAGVEESEEVSCEGWRVNTIRSSEGREGRVTRAEL